jgi:hypothetical protein
MQVHSTAVPRVLGVMAVVFAPANYEHEYAAAVRYSRAMNLLPQTETSWPVR